MREPLNYRSIGHLKGAERLIRPVEPRYVPFGNERRDLETVVPIESVRAGDEQVLAAAGAKPSTYPVIDIGRLAEFPTVRSVIATTDIVTERSLREVQELMSPFALLPSEQV